ncbi:MAG: regulatory protein RecX [Gammaproteobacteria bacterium]|nr:regulatory protein RecX [Gammaproteobacteria bacterium]
MTSRKTRWQRPEDDTPDPQALERTAVGLLARREHSRAELLQKLTSRGYAVTEVELLLDWLAAQRLQSDARFAASYARMRSGRGYGSQRIRAELRERGVAAELVDHELATVAGTHAGRIDDIWRRKFAGRLPQDYRERARQMRFLQQRGFPLADIHALFGRLSAGDD